MSYCRWSATSDVYVYANMRGGWTTHVTDSPEAMHDETAALCADRLEVLRAAGLRVPQEVIDRLRGEAVMEMGSRNENHH